MGIPPHIYRAQKLNIVRHFYQSISGRASINWDIAERIEQCPTFRLKSLKVENVIILTIRGSHERFKSKKNKIYLFGVEFADRNVGEWVVEKW